MGKGASGEVKKAYDTKQNEFIAIKTFEKQNQGNLGLEHDLLQKIEEIRNSNQKFQEYFLKYYGVYKDNNNLILRMENGCASLDNILESGKVFSLQELVYVHRRIVEALAILEENGIANRDIKPNNIILVEDPKRERNYFYKLSDFGIGCRFLSNKASLIPYKTICGWTKPYVAPEVEKIQKINPSLIEDQKYNPFKADVFSLGILTLKMINYKWGKNDLKNGLLNQKEMFKGYESILSLLKGMLNEDPEDRWDFKTIENFYKSKYDNSEGNLNNIDEKEMIPKNITKFYHKWLINIKEKGNKDLGTLAEEHWNFYGAYKENVTRPKEAKFHLNRTYENLEKLRRCVEIYNVIDDDKSSSSKKKKKFSKNELNNLNSILKERMIFCLLGHGDHYMLKGKLKRSEEYFDKVSQKINELHLEQEHQQSELEENKTREHIKYLESLLFNSLALLYEKRGDLQKTEEFFLKSMKIKKEVLGENNSDFAMSLNNLAGLYQNVGKLEKAEEFFSKSMKICIDIFGETHSYVANTMNNLAALYHKLGNYQKAKEFYHKSLKIRTELFGQKHSEVAISMNNLGMLYKDLGNYEKTEELFLKSLNISIDIFGENHANVAITTNNLAIFYQTRKNFKKAIEFYLKSLKISKTLFGNNHINVATTLNNIALLFRKLGNLEQSENFFMESLKITIKLFGENHSDVAISMNDLALLYEDLGKFQNAEKLHQKSIKILVDIFGEINPNVATSMLNLAQLYENLGNFLKSKELNIKSMNISLKLFGENHNNVFRAMNNLSMVYEKLGNLEKSYNFFFKSMNIKDNLNKYEASSNN